MTVQSVFYGAHMPASLFEAGCILDPSLASPGAMKAAVASLNAQRNREWGR